MNYVEALASKLPTCLHEASVYLLSIWNSCATSSIIFNADYT